MTAPVSNQNPLNVNASRNQRSETLSGREERKTGTVAEETAAAPADSLTLSDAAKRLNESEAAEGTERGPKNEEQAMELLSRLRLKMGENPGFAHAVHTAGANSRLAALLESPPA